MTDGTGRIKDPVSTLITPMPAWSSRGLEGEMVQAGVIFHYWLPGRKISLANLSFDLVLLDASGPC